MEVDSDADSRFLEGTRHFLSWFQSLPGATFHKDIAIEDLRSRNAGRGIGEASWGSDCNLALFADKTPKQSPRPTLLPTQFFSPSHATAFFARQPPP